MLAQCCLVRKPNVETKFRRLPRCPPQNARSCSTASVQCAKSSNLLKHVHPSRSVRFPSTLAPYLYLCNRREVLFLCRRLCDALVGRAGGWRRQAPSAAAPATHPLLLLVLCNELFLRQHGCSRIHDNLSFVKFHDPALSSPEFWLNLQQLEECCSRRSVLEEFANSLQQG